MRVLEGKSVFSGIAIGKISILQKADTSVKRTRVEDPEAEIARVQEAKVRAYYHLDGEEAAEGAGADASVETAAQTDAE
mgnify:CR=1 FL=1